MRHPAQVPGHVVTRRRMEARLKSDLQNWRNSNDTKAKLIPNTLAGGVAEISRENQPPLARILALRTT